MCLYHYELKTVMKCLCFGTYGVIWLNVPHINLCILPFLSCSLKANVLGYENDFVPSISEGSLIDDSSSLQKLMIVQQQQIEEPSLVVKS